MTLNYIKTALHDRGAIFPYKYHNKVDQTELFCVCGFITEVCPYVLIAIRKSSLKPILSIIQMGLLLIELFSYWYNVLFFVNWNDYPYSEMNYSFNKRLSI